MGSAEAYMQGSMRRAYFARRIKADPTSKLAIWAFRVFAPGPVRSPMLSVSIAGAGTARFDDLNADVLRFDISGAGEGQLTGQVQSLSLGVSGKGKVTADQLRVGTASVSISGVANAELWVTDTLRVDISGAGHVGYWGQPKVRQSISGLGSVDPRGEKR